MSFSSEKRRYMHGTDADQSSEQKPAVPIIGLSAEELQNARNSSFWRPIRYSLFLAYWLLWAGFLAGTTVIVVLNNGDVATTVAPTTTSSTH